MKIMLNTLVVIFVIIISHTVAAESSQLEDLFSQKVFVQDKEYPVFRIPSLVVTQKGTLLAIAEGRQSYHDHSQNNIVLKRSIDMGKTWGDIIIVAKDGANCLNNPCAVVLPDTGRIILFYQYYPENYHSRAIGDKIKAAEPGVSGDNVARSFMTYSDDDGLTWSSSRDLTTQVKRDYAVAVASGPGIGIVLQKEPYKGRIVFPFFDGGKWAEADPGIEYSGTRPLYVYTAYSDDEGESWVAGNSATYKHDRPGGNGFGDECQVVELSNGTLMLNSRSSNGNKFRKRAFSNDGGHTWSTLYDEPELPEPQCMGSIIRYSGIKDGEKSRILFSCPASQDGRPGTRVSRTLGTIYISYDDGRTWPVSKIIYKDMYAYSCLAVLQDGSIGVLFEKDGFETITFARFTLDWLTGGEDNIQ